MTKKGGMTNGRIDNSALHLETFFIRQTSTQRAAPAVWFKSDRSNLGHRETPKFYKPITFEYNSAIPQKDFFS
ncbi:MAG: hypothetical protein DRP78_00940 [Candidatus Omnitrophota bacterium]|nr:MAG: hypothetical protein DRP78_00940 [Candidatus Omnitrophota bacterium]